MNILIINGPNLNLLGKRETKIYGKLSFEEYLASLQKKFSQHHIEYFQSNLEGEIINQLHQSEKNTDGILLNAGGYSHTSVSIRDAISAIKVPVIEIHISNILKREKFRHISIIGGVCAGSIMGFGLDSYLLGVVGLENSSDTWLVCKSAGG